MATTKLVSCKNSTIFFLIIFNLFYSILPIFFCRVFAVNGFLHNHFKYIRRIDEIPINEDTDNSKNSNNNIKNNNKKACFCELNKKE